VQTEIKLYEREEFILKQIVPRYGKKICAKCKMVWKEVKN